MNYKKMIEEGKENEYFTAEAFRESFKDTAVSRMVRRFSIGHQVIDDVRIF